jgi:hypothetical protein
MCRELCTPYRSLCVFAPLREVSHGLGAHAKAQRRKGLVLLLSFLSFAGSSVCASGQQLDLLRKMPPDLLRYTGGARPNADGMAGYNRDGFKSPEFQCGAMHYLVRAVVRRDARCTAEGWSAIEATFGLQAEEGHFGSKGAPHGGPSGVAFWLAELDQAVLILRESEFGPKYQERIKRLVPKIHKAARWLAQPAQQSRLKRDDADAPNRLLFDALACGLSGILAGDDELKRLGRQFVDLAMREYRDSDGVFLEKGGHDSSYQAVAALKLQVWTIYFPDKKLEAAAERAVRWERARVGEDGSIDVTGNTRTGLGQEQWRGHEKGVNLSEITLCLLYDFARTDNEDSLAAARRIVERRKT